MSERSQPFAADRAGRISLWQRPGLRPGALVVAGLVLVTLMGWGLVRAEHHRLEVARFERHAQRMEQAVRDEFAPLEQSLRGLHGLVWAADLAPSAEDWAEQVRRVVPYLGAGFEGMGFVRRVWRKNLEVFEARHRLESGYANFQAERTTVGEELYLVVNYADAQGAAAPLGFDLGAGVTRRRSLDRAAREDNFAMSGMIRLLVEEGEAPGVLLSYPVYSTDTPSASPAVREQELLGWVYAAVRLDRKLAEVGTSDGLLRLTLADPPREPPADGQPGYSVTKEIELYGHPWTLHVSTTPEFHALGRSQMPLLVLAGGLLFSLLGGWLTYLLYSGRERATAMARHMTLNLRRAEAESRRLATVASRTRNAVILADAAWRIEWVNEGFTRTFGYTLEEVKGRRPGDFLLGEESDPTGPARIDAACAANEPFVGELVQYDKTGRAHRLEAEVRRLTDEAGRSEGYMSLMTDVTDARRISRDLAAKEEQLRFIFYSLPVGVGWQRFDEQGREEEFRLSEWFFNIWGVAREDMADRRRMRAMTHPEDQESLAEVEARLKAREIKGY